MKDIAPLIVECSPDAICVTDTHANILYVNPAFSRITQYSLDEVLGKNPNILSSGKHDDAYYHDLWRSLTIEGYWEGEIWNRRKNKQIYPEWLRITALKDGAGSITHYVSQFSDITHQKHNEQKMHQLAYYDGITGLPNRKLLMERLEYSIANANRYHHKLALLFLDLDHFKEINDTYGHDVGDQMLSEMSQRLLSCKRAGDTVARLGGDEFVWLAPEVNDLAEIEGCANRIKAIFGRPFVIEHHAFKVTASIGISLYPDDGETAEALLKAADSAMYRAKKLGRDRSIFFDASMLTSFDSYQQVANAFVDALQENKLMVKLRPRYVIDALTGSPVPQAYLFSHIFWEDQGFIIDQSELFRLAKVAGYSLELNHWIIDETVKKWLKLQKKHPTKTFREDEIALSIVLSTDQIPSITKTWLEFLINKLVPTNLKPYQVELVFQENLLSYEKALSLLASAGFKVGIMDFCLNVSPLISLSRSLIQSAYLGHVWLANAVNYDFHRKVLAAVVGVAQSLNLEIIVDSDLSSGEIEMAKSLGISQLTKL